MKFFGLGNLVLDIYYEKSGEFIEYKGADGGGSVFNLLSHLSSSFDFDCEALGFYGNDFGATVAINSLKSLGVKTHNLKKLTGVPTRQIHITIPVDKIFLIDSVKSTTVNPLSGESHWYNVSRDFFIPKSCFQPNSSTFLVDSVTKRTASIARELALKGIISIADIGHIGHLRYLSEEAMDEVIEPFNIIQFNKKALDFIVKKKYPQSLVGAENSPHAELIDKFIESLGKKLVVVTNGEHGGVVYSNKGLEKSEYKALNNGLIKDPTGAGDSFFSSLINSYFKEETRGLQSHDSLGLAIDNALEYTQRTLNGNGARFALHELSSIDYSSVMQKSLKKISANRPKITRPLKKTSNVNVNILYDRIIRATTEQIQSSFQTFYNSVKGNGIVVGTGGSYPVAHFVSNLFSNSSRDVFTKALKPLEVVHSNISKCDFVIAFSYSGTTSDIREVFKAVLKYPDVPFFLITNSTMKDLAVNGYQFRKMDLVVSYRTATKAQKERGFLSFAGTVIPIALFLRAWSGDVAFNDWSQWLSERFEKWTAFFNKPNSKIALKRISECSCCEIFTDIDTYTGALDLESKLTESGVAPSIIHDKKDFSHGRFVLSHNREGSFFVFFQTAFQYRYDNELLKYVESKFGEENTIILKTDQSSYLGEFDLLLAVQIMIKSIGLAMDADVSKPSYPKEAIKLYRYSKGLKSQ